MLTVEQIKDEASYCGFIGSVDQLVVFLRRIEAASAVPPELFAQQIAAAMRFADAPLTHDQFVTLVLYLKALGDGGTDNASLSGGRRPSA